MLRLLLLFLLYPIITFAHPDISAYLVFTVPVLFILVFIGLIVYLFVKKIIKLQSKDD